jgi:hypothetical protein
MENAVKNNEVKVGRIPRADIAAAGQVKKVRHKVTVAEIVNFQNELQRECVEWSNASVEQYPLLKLLFSPVSGSKTKTLSEIIKLNGLGARKGMPRLMIPVANVTSPKKPGQYSGLAIEIKRENDGLSSEQRLWLAQLKEHGYLCLVIHSLAEFKDAVAKFHAPLSRNE